MTEEPSNSTVAKMPLADAAKEAVRESLHALRAPFPPEQIGKLPKGAVMLDYVGHADITARLLDVDPYWSWEPFAVTPEGLPALDKEGNLWIRLTVCGVTRIGVGDGKSAKERIGDALRNAAMRFGAALELWAKGDRDFAKGAVESHEAKPQHVTEVLAALADLPTDVKQALRFWYDSQNFPPIDLLTESQAAQVMQQITWVTSGSSA